MAAIIPAVAVGIAAGDQARLMLNDGVNQLLVGEANYLRDGQPESVVGQIGLAIGRAACRSYSTSAQNLPGRSAARYEAACRPYLDDIGMGPGPSIAPPLNGGQCNALYTVSSGPYTVTLTSCSTGAVTFSGPGQERARANVQGPIQSAAAVVTQNGPCGPGLIVFRVVDANGVSFDVGTLATRGSQSVRVAVSGLVPVFTRQGGLPDDCGRPAPVTTPPPTPVDPIGNPFRFNPSPDIDVDINVDILPDGQITFDIGTGDITIDPFGGGDSGSGGGGTAPPGDVGSPGAPVETGQGGEASGEAPEGEVLTGLRVNFASPPVGGNQYAPGVYRGVCYAYMGTPDGLDHDPAGAMLRDGQFIFAEKDNLTRWAVRANMGYDLRVTPYYRPVEGEG